jgi:hypothetical protein
MAGFLKRVGVERMLGERPSPPRALGAAVVVGATAAAITYRLLRHEAEES